MLYGSVFHKTMICHKKRKTLKAFKKNIVWPNMKKIKLVRTRFCNNHCVLMQLFKSITCLRPHFGLSQFCEPLCRPIQLFWTIMLDNLTLLRCYFWPLTFFEVLFQTVQFFWGLILVTWTFLRYDFNQSNLFEVACRTVELVWGSISINLAFLRLYFRRSNLFEVLFLLLRSYSQDKASTKKPDQNLKASVFCSECVFWAFSCFCWTHEL